MLYNISGHERSESTYFDSVCMVFPSNSDLDNRFTIGDNLQQICSHSSSAPIKNALHSCAKHQQWGVLQGQEFVFSSSLFLITKDTSSLSEMMDKKFCSSSLVGKKFWRSVVIVTACLVLRLKSLQVFLQCMVESFKVFHFFYCIIFNWDKK